MSAARFLASVGLLDERIPHLCMLLEMFVIEERMAAVRVPPTKQ